ncbi:hypothetical protein Tco_1001224 [Tanacetum coccineum]
MESSLSAAIDYYVSKHRDIFVSVSLGNVHNVVVDHRAYLYQKPCRPNMALLGQLFVKKSTNWSVFQEAVVEWQRNRLLVR